MPEEDSKSNVKRVCSNCKSTETTKRTKQWKKKDGSIAICEFDAWHRDKKGGWYCDKCYHRLVTNPKWNPINSPKWNPIIHAKHGPRRITYKGKRIQLKDLPRCGVCNWCRAVKGEINAQTGELCEKTDRAHLEYHDDDPLKDSIELCASCHMYLDELGGDAKEKKGKRKY